MKTSIFYFLLSVTSIVFAQNSTPSQAYFNPITISEIECIPDAHRQNILQEIETNKRAILEVNPEIFQYRTTTHPLFELPFKAKSGFTDYGYYSLFNQVDHNLAPGGQLLDYNCGERTYDWTTGNHAGTDYVVWPYPWKKMEENVMEIVAAAPGIIIQKKDGYFDKNCVNNGNPNWNGVILEHSDGSQSWYWHFKDGSTTTKNVGDTVASGEYLGLAGSSGSSTIPHLHFEVHDAAGDLIDPYAGPCNDLNSDSWWIEQPDYMVPEILTLSTHYSEILDDDCGEIEDTYEELNFLPGETIYFKLFYRDIQTGDITNIQVKKPNGNILWDYDFISEWPNNFAAWAYWIWPTDSTWEDGVYNVTVTFGGKTYETIFGINTNLLVNEPEINEVLIFPNPTSDFINVQSVEEISSISVYDLAGREISKHFPQSVNTTIDFSGFNTGIYLVKVDSADTSQTFKISKL